MPFSQMISSEPETPRLSEDWGFLAAQSLDRRCFLRSLAMGWSVNRDMWPV